VSICYCAAVKDNSRYSSLQFEIDQDIVLHGFGGYFYCLLYADISFSMSLRLLQCLSARDLLLNCYSFGTMVTESQNNGRSLLVQSLFVLLCIITISDVAWVQQEFFSLVRASNRNDTIYRGYSNSVDTVFM